MRLSDIKGDRCFEVLGEIIVPLMTMFQDDEVKKKLSENRLVGIAYMSKTYPKDLLHIMATIEGKENEADYNPNFIEVAGNLADLISDPVFISLFTSAGQNQETSSGSASENTEA